MYPIEILSTSVRTRAALDRAISSLNMIQREFHFYRPADDADARANVLGNTAQHADDLYEWLKKYKNEVGGNIQFLVLIIDGRLSTKQYGDAFGWNHASKGFAIFTTHNQADFVADLIRYIRYYLVRYAISFV